MIDKLIKQQERLAESAETLLDVSHMKMKALIDFQNGKRLTDRQEELVREVLDEQRELLETNLQHLVLQNDLTMELSEKIGNELEEINRMWGEL